MNLKSLKPEESVRLVEESRLNLLYNDGELLCRRAMVKDIAPGIGNDGSIFIMVFRNNSIA